MASGAIVSEGRSVSLVLESIDKFLDEIDSNNDTLRLELLDVLLVVLRDVKDALKVGHSKRRELIRACLEYNGDFIKPLVNALISTIGFVSESRRFREEFLERTQVMGPVKSPEINWASRNDWFRLKCKTPCLEVCSCPKGELAKEALDNEVYGTTNWAGGYGRMELTKDVLNMIPCQIKTSEGSLEEPVKPVKPVGKKKTVKSLRKYNEELAKYERDMKFFQGATAHNKSTTNAIPGNMGGQSGSLLDVIEADESFDSDISPEGMVAFGVHMPAMPSLAWLKQPQSEKTDTPAGQSPIRGWIGKLVDFVRRTHQSATDDKAKLCDAN